MHFYVGITDRDWLRPEHIDSEFLDRAVAADVVLLQEPEEEDEEEDEGDDKEDDDDDEGYSE